MFNNPAARPGKACFIDIPAVPDNMPEAAQRLLKEQPDLILVSGLPALLALSAQDISAGISAVPVVALSPECTPDALRFSANSGLLPSNFHLFPEQYWSARLKALREVTGFTRLGFILPPKGNAAQEALGSLLTLASNGVGSNKVGIVSVELADLSEASCREAVDELFFEEIDALLLDASGCFAPEREGREELLELLRQRGILPLSLTDSEAVKHGALLAPWQGESARLGRLIAVALQAYTGSGTNFAKYNENPMKAFLAEQSAYTLNLDIAGSMGFDPPTTLLALVREFFP
jgi:hypothetical protein